MKLTVAKWEQKEGNQLTSNGLIRVNPNKPEYGSLILLHVAMSISNGFANKRTKVGFITGAVDDLKDMITSFGLKEGSDFSEKVAPHKIVTIEKVESEVPENQGFREKINPTTGEVLTKNGESIYWKTEVIAEGLDTHDELIQHDKETVDEAVQEFQGAAQNQGTTK